MLAFRAAVASRLTWRFGFGPGTVLLVAVAALAAVLATGLVRWLAAAVAVLAATYVVLQYRKWNRPGWRRVHHRAMLAYASIVAGQRVAGKEEGTRPDTYLACRYLGLLLCGDDKPAVVDAMLTDLVRLQGGFLVGLIERHGAPALHAFPPGLRHDVMVHLRERPFGPALVIAAVIENVYGGPEAARYAVALATGEAR